jgi:FAD/FMN-containing dehydrogenase
LVEAQRPDGEVVLSLEKLNRILAIDAQARLATAEAGVSIDALNAALEPSGLMFPLEMGSSSAATLGACVANGSAGANAVCYGTAANLCDAAWGFWGDGRAAGPEAGAPWQMPPRERLAINSARFGNHLIGSQGALGVITRVRLRLQPIPAQREAALIPVQSMPAAMDVLAAARAEFGGDVEEFEFISREAMELVRLAKGSAFRWPFERDPQARFYLLLQVKAASVDADLTARLYDFLAKELALPDEHLGYAPLKALKEIRHSITESSNLRMRARGGGRLAFDTAAPAARFGDYLDALESAIRAAHPQVEFVAFGHAGVGGAHLHLLGDAAHSVDASARELDQIVLDVTEAFGGTFSAEHGVGTKWAEEFAKRTPAAALREMVAAKRMRDPRNVLNPRCFGFDRLLGTALP